MILQCSVCGKDFHTKPARVANGRGKYCSRECSKIGVPITRTRSIEARFWEKVDTSGDCWNWTGSKDKRGYGKISTCRGSVPMLATRLSYQIAYGYFDPSLFVCHKCDNPTCVRPEHLFLGTAKDNMEDCSRKARTTQGEKSASAKLNTKQVLEIRALAESGYTHQQIADIYNISRRHITDIVNRERWTHI